MAQSSRPMYYLRRKRGGRRGVSLKTKVGALLPQETDMEVARRQLVY